MYVFLFRQCCLCWSIRTLQSVQLFLSLDICYVLFCSLLWCRVCTFLKKNNNCMCLCCSFFYSLESKKARTREHASVTSYAWYLRVTNCAYFFHLKCSPPNKMNRWHLTCMSFIIGKKQNPKVLLSVPQSWR